ncbi:DUF4912 domain-containing protein [Leptolyngbyaceae cyanobacterium UHCC 1019]
MANWEGVLQTRLRFLLAIAATSVLLSASLIGLEPQKIAAQTTPALPTFKLPDSLPSGTTVKVDGSSSMMLMNEALKKRFQDKFPGATVNLAEIGTEKAIKSLLDGKVNIAAVGRPLTQAEQDQGLIEAPMSREKVAIIVGSNNSFNKSITFDQFARIYRGEITDWSQLGGAPGPIRMVDRPDFSDTRRALSQYTVFQGKPFKTGSTATTVAEDSTAAVIQKLGKDGIGYAIADQVVDQPTVKVLPLHETLPDDPRYPFSQHRGYVYQGEPDPATLAFLGIAVSKPGQEVVQAAKPTEAKSAETNPAVGAMGSPSLTASSTVAPSASISPTVDPAATESPTVAPTAETQTADSSAMVATETRPFPWWWLVLPLVGLGGLLAAMKGRSLAVPVAAPLAVPLAALDPDRSRIVLTPKTCRAAYAYWELSDKDKAAFGGQSGHNLALRLYDVTSADLNRQSAQSVKQFDLRENEQDHHLPLTLDDRDYVVELGSVAENGDWLKIARSEAVRVPACTPAEKIRFAATAAAGATAPPLSTAAIASGAGAAAVAGVAGLGLAGAGAIAASTALAGQSTPAATSETVPPEIESVDSNQIILVPRSADSAYAYWEVSEESKAALKQQGGENLTLRVHDITDINFDRYPAHSTQQHSCSDLDTDQHVPISRSDRDYIAELGYLTQDNRWLELAKSEAVRVPAAQLAKPPGAFAVAAAAAATSTKLPTTNRAAPPQGIASALAGGAAAVAGVGAMAKSFLEKGSSTVESDQESDRVETESDTLAPDLRIILVPRTSDQAYAYWEVANSQKEPLRQQGGKQLTLRIHDVTNIDIDHQPPHSTEAYPCLETDHDKHIPIPTGGTSYEELGYRDYLAELGYFTDDNHWLTIVRSLHVRIPQTNERIV